MPIKYNFNDLYFGVIQNRQVMFNTHHKSESKVIFFLRSLSFCFVLMYKISISFFFKKREYPTFVGINWSSHKKRLLDFDEKMEVIEYFYKKSTSEQFRIFSGINILNIFKFLFQIKQNTLPKHNNYDNLFYRIVNAIEFSMFINLLENRGIDEVMINGLNDRYTIYISEICKKNGIKFSIIQHGALTKFEGCFTVEVDKFYYMYDFSIGYLKYFITNYNEIELSYCPNKKKVLNLSNYENNSMNIAYACTPSNIDMNFQIVDSILAGLDKSITLIVHPHPREDNSIYVNRYCNDSNVFVTKTKYKNIQFLVTRISSLGVELNEIGITPIFLNLERHETDFLDTGKYLTFTRLIDFDNWLKNDSIINEFYK